MTLWLPDVSTVDPISVILAIIAGCSLLVLHWGLATTLALTGTLSLMLYLLM